MPASAKAGGKKAGDNVQDYVKRSRKGAARAAKDPQTWKRLNEQETGRPVTRKQFAKRFLSG